ncbi:excinuclease ABC subunit UvrA [Fusobacterium periodonticum]|jgi:excinuclease ABC, A subunit|uniref:UvrABC system protein A n=3 Tax=Fusobacterium periodonticum TaxID=860 RepID=K1GIF3_9FUSO|nr:excinuclease ABC subunit UvrA [Fusobacterium periodonticum]AVQ25590.1 excinuclease ABC subunit UvrA [Fusobacterium periodonticum]EKA93804.1 excinuclease ABC subunit A [Fusobacterium periodonticum D10]KGE62146.1 excinuclease ABC subunit A [Fusobacterium periodonticum 2_1_31]
MIDKITIKGARQHNLKNIDIELPKNEFIVITGVSGSGKSSLAFDTIYSEGQRRYVESLSAYARQFIGQMNKPEVDSIEGLSPAISIEQKTTNRNPRSTVGTITEVYDYLRLLFAHIGIAHCPICHTAVEKQSVDEIVESIMSKFDEGSKIILLSPVVKDKKGTHKNIFLNLFKKGFVRARVNGEVLYLEDEIELDKNKKHNIEVVVDRLVLKKDDKDFESRLTQSIEAAIELSNGKLIVNDGKTDYLYSENYSCPNHEDVSIPELNPRLFSFNAPYGACPECKGLGKKLEVDENKLIENPDLSIEDGGMYIPGAMARKGYSWEIFRAMAKAAKIDLTKPVKDLTKKELDIIFYGYDEKFKFDYTGGDFDFHGYKEYEGAVKNLERRYYESFSEAQKEEIENRYMVERICKVCKGKRLKDEVLAVTVNDKNIMEICDMSIKNSLDFFMNLSLTEKQEKIAKEILKEIRERLTFMTNVGLDYLTLSRETKTLSGGESQRIRLATQIGSGLTGVLYVLDEPSIGLHQKDNDKLLATLNRLKELGNTLIVVEHDEDTMMQADKILDIGPGAGTFGGEIVAFGSPKEIMKNKNSITGKFLSGKEEIEIPKKRRKWNKTLKLFGAKGNNLKNIDVEFPLGVMTVVTGVSGSGKSTLVNSTLYPILFNKLNKGKLYPLEYDKIEGLEELEKVINIDQTPIGRTPRSNPATYTKLFDDIRDIFAETQDAKLHGFKKGRFSFNVKGGRCEACQGAGILKIEMNFLPDVYVECEVCKGKRYNKETLDVYYKGKNIYDVLEMSVLEAYDFFKNIPTLERKLKVLIDVGLDYIKLGQPATTLSGGEAQRIKLATELSKMSKGNTVYILDEPTTGLHFQDIKKLLEVLNRLLEKGNTVIIIEHNLDVIKTADHIIDIGVDGGENGGTVVATGTPEEIAKSKKSYTGKYIAKILKKKK